MISPHGSRRVMMTCSIPISFNLSWIINPIRVGFSDKTSKSGTFCNKRRCLIGIYFEYNPLANPPKNTTPWSINTSRMVMYIFSWISSSFLSLPLVILGMLSILR